MALPMVARIVGVVRVSLRVSVKLDSGVGAEPILEAPARGGRGRGVVRSAVARVRRSDGGPGTRPVLRVSPHGILAMIGLSLGHVLRVVPRKVAGSEHGGPRRCVRRRWDVVRMDEAGLDGAEVGEALACRVGVGSLALLGDEPRLPVLQPRLVVVALVEVDVQVPFARNQPLDFHPVELGDFDAADFGPRLVLEGVIVQELASKQQRNGEQSPDLAFAGLEGTPCLASVDSLGEVVEAQEDGGAWQPGGGEDLGHEFPEGRSNGGLGRNNAHRHIGHVFRHDINLVVENGTHATSHDDGMLGVSW